MADKKRVRVEFLRRMIGEGEKSVTINLILPDEYDTNEKDWQGDVRADFWDNLIVDKRLTEKIEIKEIATV